MPFRDSFPWTSALLRFLSSKPFRIFWAVFATVLISTMVGFRLESFVFQRRVSSILVRMAEVRLDHSSEQETRQLLPELNLSTDAIPNGACDGMRRYEVTYSDLDRGVLVRFLWRLWQNDAGIRLLYLLGHRFHRFSAAVEACNGKVVRVQYGLWVDTAEDHNLYSGAGLTVAGLSRAGWRKPGGEVETSYEDLIPYTELVASNAPESYLALTFTPVASGGFVRAAFDVHLNCLWSPSPCKTTKQLLPGIWPPSYPWRR